jgi:hypothetical protein
MIDEDCIICCDKKATFIEKIFLNKLNINSLDYPIIPFSYAYNCSCKTTFAHNKCLELVNKCPLCRKFVNKPNLHIEVYFEKYLIYIKNDIFMILYSSAYLLVFLFLIFIILVSNKYIYINYYYILFIYHIIHTYVLVITYSLEFIKKYWLYDDNLKTFY